MLTPHNCSIGMGIQAAPRGAPGLLQSGAQHPAGSVPFQPCSGICTGTAPGLSSPHEQSAGVFGDVHGETASAWAGRISSTVLKYPPAAL